MHRYLSHGLVHRRHVGGSPGALAEHLGRGVDGEENNVGAGDAGYRIACEEQVGTAFQDRHGRVGDGIVVFHYCTVSGHPDHVDETRFVDREVW